MEDLESVVPVGLARGGLRKDVQSVESGMGKPSAGGMGTVKQGGDSARVVKDQVAAA